MSLEAEQNLIACAMISDEYTAKLMEIPETWFQSNSSKLIHRAVSDLTAQSLSSDMFAIAEELKRSNQLELAGGMRYIVELSESLPSFGYWDSYKNSLFNNYKKNQLEQINKNMAMQLQHGAKPAEIIEWLQSGLIDLLTDHHSGGFERLENHFGGVLDELEWRQQHPGEYMGQSFGFKQIDEKTDGGKDGTVIVVAGRPGCLSGETKLYVSRGNKCDGSGRYYTLAELYRGHNGMLAKKGGQKWDLSIPTMVQSLKDDDLTGLNLCEQVIYSGVKDTYTVTTESGKEIRATKDHMFLTENGFMPLSDLHTGSEVICKAPRKTARKKQKSPYRKEVCTKMPFSPYPTRVINGCTYNRVLEQRVVYDGYLNGMNLQDFIKELKENPNHNLKFSDAKMHIHHKDEDRLNNDPSNLVLLSASDHTKEHAKNEILRDRFGLNRVRSEKITSIEFYGKEDTYDICCADPHNNFIANEFVTHNSGKTAFALKIAKNLASKKQDAESESHWLYFSFEMSGKALAKRALVTESKVHNSKFKTGKLSDGDYASVAGGITRLQDVNLHIDPSPGLSIQQMRSRLKAAQVKFGKVGGIIIDHIGLVKKTNGKTDTESMNYIADSILSMAKEFNCPVIELCQLNRGTEGRADKRPMMSDLKQSGKIEENADIIFLLYRGDYYDPNEPPITELNIAKNRDGETGTIYLEHNMGLGEYKEISDYTPPEPEKKTRQF